MYFLKEQKNIIKFLDKFEYEVVAVVSNDAGIKSKYDLKDKLLCHPGYGYETDWTSILANVINLVKIKNKNHLLLL